MTPGSARSTMSLATSVELTDKPSCRMGFHRRRFGPSLNNYTNATQIFVRAAVSDSIFGNALTT